MRGQCICIEDSSRWMSKGIKEHQRARRADLDPLHCRGEGILQDHTHWTAHLLFLLLSTGYISVKVALVFQQAAARYACHRDAASVQRSGTHAQMRHKSYP